MYHTLTHVQSGQPTRLLRPLDNNANMRIGLRSITYTVGWHNLDAQKIHIRPPGGGITIVNTEAGLYNFDQLQSMFKQQQLVITVSRYNGIANLVVPLFTEVQLSDQMCGILALDVGMGGQWMVAGVHTGARPVSFATLRSLHVHLEQLDTFQNCIDGKPSTLLATVGLGGGAFGDIATTCIEGPIYKPMVGGPISELKVVIRDDSGKMLDNHDLPISLVLEVSQ